MREGIFTVRDRHGLHARAAARFVQKALQYRSKVSIEKDGTRADGKSIIQLLMLGSSVGTDLVVTVEGPDEEQAFVELKQVLEGPFDET